MRDELLPVIFIVQNIIEQTVESIESKPPLFDALIIGMVLLVIGDGLFFSPEHADGERRAPVSI